LTEAKGPVWFGFRVQATNNSSREVRTVASRAKEGTCLATLLNLALPTLREGELQRPSDEPLGYCPASLQDAIHSCLADPRGGFCRWEIAV